jgi:hypothetical protein
MAFTLIVDGVLANCGPEPSDELIQLLLLHTRELEIFRLRPPEPGFERKAAFDWRAIVGTGADLLAFGELLWAAYERFVKPRLERRSIKGFEPRLIIVIGRSNDRYVEFSLGTDFQDKDVFVEHFERTVSELRDLPEGDREGERIAEVTRSESWVRVSMRGDTSHRGSRTP